MSSSAAILSLPTDVEYLDVGAKEGVERPVLPLPFLQAVQQRSKRAAEIQLSREEFAQRLRQERSEAMAQEEQRLRRGHEAEIEKLRGGVTEAIAAFEAQRSEYFAQVEAEVVQLALSIAAKVLHREAQVDPMLVAALVRLTIEKMREGSSVTVRVGIDGAKAWQQYFANHATHTSVRVVENAEVSGTDCVLETEFGTTHLGLERQLKEVEQGLFDLLALRPNHP
jgi:flagellar assembly protein FliH